MSRRKADAAAVVFALLVLASVAAFAYAQRVKRDPVVIDHFPTKSRTLTPKGECHRRVKLRFRTTTTNDHATVEVIRQGGEVVSVLAKKTFLKRYTFHTYYWYGTNEDGVVQPPGRYQLRVLLEEEGRELTLPAPIRLHKPRRGEC